MKKAMLFSAAALVLAIVVAACGGGQPPAVQPTAEPAATQGSVTGQAAATLESTAMQAVEPAPTAEAAPTEAAEEDLSLDSVTEGLDQLQSYKSRYTIDFSGKDGQGQGAEYHWEMEEAFIVDPPARQIIHSSDRLTAGQVVESNRTEIITIGQTNYIIAQEEDGTQSCTSYSSSEANPPDQTLSPDMWGGVSGARYVNTETVNGIRCKHYSWTEDSLAAFGWGLAEGDTWVAVDGGYVVKQAIEGSGKGFLLADDTHEGVTTIDYELTEVNGSFEIAPPQGCEGPSTDVPVMADAKDSMTYGDMISYRTTSPFADVAAFYKAEMPAAGWQESGEAMETPEFVQLIYTKEARTATVMLSFDKSANETAVMVQVAEE